MFQGKEAAVKGGQTVAPEVGGGQQQLDHAQLHLGFSGLGTFNDSRSGRTRVVYAQPDEASVAACRALATRLATLLLLKVRVPELASRPRPLCGGFMVASMRWTEQ